MYEWSIHTVDSKQQKYAEYSNRCPTIEEARKEMTNIILELISTGELLISSAHIWYFGEVV